MGHENENRMMFDNFPKHVEEQDPDEAYDELRQEELDQSWYDLKEIAAEQRRLLAYSSRDGSRRTKLSE
jgi:hypothetical protein